MLSEPRDSAIQVLRAATIRVCGGTGVVVDHNEARLVVTAWHVVEGNPTPALVGANGARYQTYVLRHDAEADVAVLAAGENLTTRAVSLSNRELAVADEVHVAGFPLGWEGNEPLLSRGTVSGQEGHFIWLNADASWGHSGSPVCTVEGGTPSLAAVVHGNASRTTDELKRLVAALAKSAKRLAEIMPMAGGMRMGTEDGTIRSSDVIMDNARTAADLAAFIELHFRTGFTLAAPIGVVRKLLEST